MCVKPPYAYIGVPVPFGVTRVWLLSGGQPLPRQVKAAVLAVLAGPKKKPMWKGWQGKKLGPSHRHHEPEGGAAAQSALSVLQPDDTLFGEAHFAADHLARDVVRLLHQTQNQIRGPGNVMNVPIEDDYASIVGAGNRGRLALRCQPCG